MINLNLFILVVKDGRGDICADYGVGFRIEDDWRGDK
jgi:hypothetical protein